MDELDELDYLDEIGMNCPVRPVRPARPCPTVFIVDSLFKLTFNKTQYIIF